MSFAMLTACARAQNAGGARQPCRGCGEPLPVILNRQDCATCLLRADVARAIAWTAPTTPSFIPSFLKRRSA